MRRKIGVSVVVKKKDEASQFSKVGKTLEDTKLSAVKEALASFRENLSEFAAKHKDKINNDPEFRQQFHTMCVGLGVDPLASNKGFWADILGVGNFYFELGLKIIQICIQTRVENGGIISLDSLHNILQKQIILRSKSSNNNDIKISIEDVKRSVEKLSVLGSGFRIVNISKNNTVVISVPLEINNDHEHLIAAANDEDGGCITYELMKGLRGWSRERFNTITNPLLQEGMLWIDSYNGETYFYFYSIWKTK